MSSRNVVMFRPRDAEPTEPTAEERERLLRRARQLFAAALTSAFNTTFEETARMQPTMSLDTALRIVNVAVRQEIARFGG
jgi:cation transport regulator ChaB